MTRIPVDLYRLIVSYVERNSDLANLTQVNKDFNAEAESVLWHEIGIHTKDQVKCEVLSTNQAKADLVSKVSIRDVGPIWEISDNIQLSAIAALRRITRMTVHTDADMGWMTKLTRTYESLVHFLGYRPDEHTIAFVNRQPGIRFLHFGGPQCHLSYEDLIKFHPIASAPCLEAIISYSDLVTYFVPGNPVKYIRVTEIGYPRSSVDTTLSACALSTAPLERLSLKYRWNEEKFKAEHIDFISRHAPFLKELTIEAPLPTSDIYREGGAHARPYIEGLSRLKNLNVVTFKSLARFEDGDGNSLLDTEEHLTTCEYLLNAIVKACPHLSRVNFLSKSLLNKVAVGTLSSD